MSAVDEIQEAVNKASEVARAGALLDAELAVRRRIEMLPLYALAEAKALLNAANAIVRLREASTGGGAS